MQDYIDLAQKNGVTLLDNGACQFCGANTTKGVHECVEIFSLGFQQMDYADPGNHLFRFLSVDAHTLQHPEIHGRWNNHFHLLRLHLILKHGIHWTYQLSPQLSDYLNKYKQHKQEEFLHPPEMLHRGIITTMDVLEQANNEEQCKDWIQKWAIEVYNKWQAYHSIVDGLALVFFKERLNKINCSDRPTKWT